MSTFKLLVVALIGITIAVVLGSWLATPVQAYDSQPAGRGATAGSGAGIEESPWYLEGDQSDAQAAPDGYEDQQATPDGSEGTDAGQSTGLSYY